MILVPYNDEVGYSPKHPEVIRVNPKQQIPELITDDLELFDSTQICEYLEDLENQPNLWPKDIQLRATARLIEH